MKTVTSNRDPMRLDKAIINDSIKLKTEQKIKTKTKASSVIDPVSVRRNFSWLFVKCVCSSMKFIHVVEEVCVRK